MKPTYNPETDGNVFHWILRAAGEQRAEQTYEATMRAVMERGRLHAKAHLAPKPPKPVYERKYSLDEIIGE
jgi:hypothetical protein